MNALTQLPAIAMHCCIHTPFTDKMIGDPHLGQWNFASSFTIKAAPMNTKKMTVAGLLSLVALFSGCVGTGPNTQQGAVGGAALGALAGA